MVEKAKTPEKKVIGTKAASTPKKAPAKRKISKGQALACEVCGMSVTIDEIGDEVVEEDTVLLCCGKPMKEKATVKKAVKK